MLLQAEGNTSKLFWNAWQKQISVYFLSFKRFHSNSPFSPSSAFSSFFSWKIRWFSIFLMVFFFVSSFAIVLNCSNGQTIRAEKLNATLMRLKCTSKTTWNWSLPHSKFSAYEMKILSRAWPTANYWHKDLCLPVYFFLHHHRGCWFIVLFGIGLSLIFKDGAKWVCEAKWSKSICTNRWFQRYEILITFNERLACNLINFANGKQCSLNRIFEVHESAFYQKTNYKSSHIEMILRRIGFAKGNRIKSN